MSKNANLIKARKDKNDEFYTQLDDISKEILGGGYNLKDFEGKTVLSNCDDPYESNFTLFFILKFRELKLKRFISTCYKGSPIAMGGLFKRITPQNNGYVLDITEKDLPPDDKMDGKTIIKYLEKNKCIQNLKGDGDFRSEECLAYLKEADIVITNPPFSLFREFVDVLMEYKKKFIIWGNNNAITYKDFFPLIRDNKVWLGYTCNKNKSFRVPDDYEKYDKKLTNKINDGCKYGTVMSISTFTNLDIDKRHKDLILYKTYKGNEKEYPKYDNYNAINVDKIADIPKDYDGIMGVPISIMGIINPEQFKLIERGDAAAGRISEEFLYKYIKIGKNRPMIPQHLCYYDSDGTPIIPYARVLIQRIDKEDK